MGEGPTNVCYEIAHVLGGSKFQSLCDLGISDVWGFP